MTLRRFSNHEFFSHKLNDPSNNFNRNLTPNAISNNINYLETTVFQNTLNSQEIISHKSFQSNNQNVEGKSTLLSCSKSFISPFSKHNINRNHNKNDNNISNHFHSINNQDPFSFNAKMNRRVSILFFHLLTSEDFDDILSVCGHSSILNCNESCLNHLDLKRKSFILSLIHLKTKLHFENSSNTINNIPLNEHLNRNASRLDFRLDSLLHSIFTPIHFYEFFKNISGFYIPWEKYRIIRLSNGEKQNIIDFIQKIQSYFRIIENESIGFRSILIQCLYFCMLTRREKLIFLNYLEENITKLTNNHKKWKDFLKKFMEESFEILNMNVNTKFIFSKYNSRENDSKFKQNLNSYCKHSHTNNNSWIYNSARRKWDLYFKDQFLIQKNIQRNVLGSESCFQEQDFQILESISSWDPHLLHDSFEEYSNKKCKIYKFPNFIYSSRYNYRKLNTNQLKISSIIELLRKIFNREYHGKNNLNDTKLFLAPNDLELKNVQENNFYNLMEWLINKL